MFPIIAELLFDVLVTCLVAGVVIAVYLFGRWVIRSLPIGQPHKDRTTVRIDAAIADTARKCVEKIADHAEQAASKVRQKK